MLLAKSNKSAFEFVKVVTQNAIDTFFPKKNVYSTAVCVCCDRERQLRNQTGTARMTAVAAHSLQQPGMVRYYIVSSLILSCHHVNYMTVMTMNYMTLLLMI